MGCVYVLRRREMRGNEEKRRKTTSENSNLNFRTEDPRARPPRCFYIPEGTDVTLAHSGPGPFVRRLLPLRPPARAEFPPESL